MSKPSWKDGKRAERVGILTRATGLTEFAVIKRIADIHQVM